VSQPQTAHTSAKRAPGCELVAFAASAGGLAAISEILSGLPADFPVALVVVQHRGTSHPEMLAHILARTTPALRVKTAEHGERLDPGTVYVSPPDSHLTILPDKTVHLHDGTRIKFVRSSANPLLESAAQSLEGRVVAVVLTGGGSDATDGVQAVKQRGGVVIAQDPTDAQVSGMPASAIASGAVDYVLRLEDIAPKLVQLAAPAG
jgi:two-component system chemotaxis response regulator CheB